MKNFQKFFGLPVTGKLDEETMYEMKKPRCGNTDLNANGQPHRQKRYSTSWDRWRKNNLKYYLSTGEDMSASDQARVIAKAFKMWSDVTPLRFTRTFRTSEADFRLRFQFFFLLIFVFVNYNPMKSSHLSAALFSPDLLSTTTIGFSILTN